MIKSIIVAGAVVFISTGAFAKVTFDENPTDKREDRRVVTEAVKQMNMSVNAINANITKLLQETQKSNQLLERLIQSGGGRR